MIRIGYISRHKKNADQKFSWWQAICTSDCAHDARPAMKCTDQEKNNADLT